MASSLSLYTVSMFAACSLAAAAPAQSEDIRDQRISTLEQEVAELRAALRTQGDHWLTEKRAEEIKGLVQDVLADADTRASLLQSSATAGYQDGFFISSADGNWLLQINMLMQQRFIWSHVRSAEVVEPDLDGGGGGLMDLFLSDLQDRNRYGFENTRSKLILSGHAVSPNWFYRLDVNFGSNDLRPIGSNSTVFDDNFGPGVPSDLALYLEDLGVPGAEADAMLGQFFNGNREDALNAYIGHDFGNGWTFRIGSMKLPFQREELVESQFQLAVERSIFNYMFTTGYSDGVQLNYTGEQFRVIGMFSDGERQGQTVWSTGPLGHADYALTGRAELRLGGTWNQFNDFTAPPDGQTAVLIGGAVHWQRSEGGDPAFTDQQKILRATVDVSAEFDGANLFGAFTWNDIDSGVSGADNWRPWGFLVQGGFYLMHDVELFARYEWLDYNFDDLGADSDVDEMSVVTGGINYYISGHNAKWSTDVGYGINPVLLPAAITGWRTDLNDSGRQIVVRSQVQIYF